MKKSILILLFALIGVFSAQAYEFEVDGIYYNRISDTSVEVTSHPYYYGKYKGAVVIPSTVTCYGTSYQVTSIGYEAFWECTALTSVTIPESVTYIGHAAFSGCTSISSPLHNSKVFAYMPENYSGDYTIPSGIQSIASCAFSDCRGLISVTIPESVTTIGNNAFHGCSGLTSVTIPESVNSIGSYAFYGCSGLTSVTIPNSVTSIGDKAFSGCSGLTSVIIPDGIDTIWYGTFAGCSGLTSVTIPNSVTSIGYSAFSGCRGLTSVTIPNGVTSIGDYAFSYCTGLTSVTIPNSVTSIGYKAFGECTALTSVTIPESVNSIGSYAFYDCSGLTSVEWNARHCRYGGSTDSPFYCHGGNHVISSITFGNQVEYIPAYLCSSMHRLTSVTIPNSVTYIGDGAFLHCGYLTSVTIGEKVDTIGSFAFGYCERLTSVTIPNSVTTIGSEAFICCTGLTSVTIGESVDTIGSEAFYYCDSLRSVEWNARHCRTNGGCPFYSNRPTYVSCIISSITFGNQVEYIPENLCGRIHSLTSVTSLSKTPPYCGGGHVFTNYSATLYVPYGSKEAYQSAEVWKNFSRIKHMGMATVTVNVNGASRGYVTGGGEYEIGEEITLTAIPNPGYRFVRWNDINGLNTDNPRTLTVTADITLTAIFWEDDNPTPNENPESDHFRVYAQDRTIHLSENRGSVQVYNMAGQCVYNGHATAIPVPQSGVYIVAVGPQRFKVPVR